MTFPEYVWLSIMILAPITALIWLVFKFRQWSREESGAGEVPAHDEHGH